MNNSAPPVIVTGNTDMDILAQVRGRNAHSDILAESLLAYFPCGRVAQQALVTFWGAPDIVTIGAIRTMPIGADLHNLQRSNVVDIEDPEEKARTSTGTAIEETSWP